MLKRFFLIALSAALLVPVQPAAAQSNPPNPTYIVQPGDTLTVIAYRFGIAAQDLIDANQITDPALIGAGTALVIPGLEGVEGTLTTQVVPLGETLTSLSRRYRFPLSQLARLNRITSPTEIYAGASVILPQEGANEGFHGIASIAEGQSLLEMAAGLNVNPWVLAENNALPAGVHALPGDTLYYNDPDSTGEFTPISELVTALEINPLPVVQGGTTVIRIRGQQPLSLQGSLNEKPLHFFALEDNEYVALQGVHAMAETGLTPFALEGTAADGSKFSFEQSVLLKPGYYGEDPPLNVDPATIDSSVTGPEDQIVRETVAPFTEEKLWDGAFLQPVDEPACIKSW
ncbi:MAG TPA: LysM peptidoglycan-binding domain-containing protein, partial [Anaerolineaceae bacterium]|nr:LysM peptidoglycan-binding domain-containing protein [Anaerolineaceae bacterium]